MKPLTLTTCQGENTVPVCTAVTEYLSTHLQTAVRFESSIPWQERSRLLDDGEIEIGWICGLSYVQKKDNTAVPLSLLAAPIMAGDAYQHQPIYTSKIIVHRDSAFYTFADLRAARFAINEPNSYSGCVLMRAHLAGLGETTDYFSDIVVSGSHWQSMQWVAHGQVDTAAIDCTLFNYIITHHPHFRHQLRVVAVLGPSPIPPLVISTAVSQKIKKRIKELLLAMAADDNGRKVLAAGNVERFTTVTDSDYDPIRQAVHQAKSVQST